MKYILKIKTVSSKENKSSSSIELIYSSHIHTINDKESTSNLKAFYIAECQGSVASL